MKTEMQIAQSDLIIIKQLPVIEQRLKTISEQIDQKVNNATSLVCNEETIKNIKAARAELSKELQSFNKQCKAVKTAIMAPYEQFQNVYKEYVSSKYEQADKTLKIRIDEIENEIKMKKRQQVKLYFDEYLLSKDIDFVTFDDAKLNITLSANIKSLQQQAKEFIDRICSDLELIKVQQHETEILVEYKKTLDCAKSIISVNLRFEAIEHEKQRQLQLEEKQKIKQQVVEKIESAISKPLSPPVVQEDDDNVCTISFKVTAKTSKLRQLKKILDDYEYQYE